MWCLLYEGEKNETLDLMTGQNTTKNTETFYTKMYVVCLRVDVQRL